jgi:hypothetical protein
MFRMLAIFHRTHGHCDVPPDSRPDSLGTWVEQQRARAHVGRLNPIQRRRLKKLGLVLEPAQLRSSDDFWTDMYQALVEFHRQHGHTRVPRDYEPEPRLRGWLNRQLCRGGQGRLTPLRREMLSLLGIQFPNRPRLEKETSWELRFKELALFKDQHGHLTVPRPPRGVNDPLRRLSVWLANQRQSHVAGRLRPDRARRLRNLGVDLRDYEVRLADRWDTYFSTLASFKRRFGHLSVPRDWPENLRLGDWLNQQKTFYIHDKLAPGRHRRLVQLGVVFCETGDARQERWDKMYALLVQFKEQHGHCDVPTRRPPHDELGQWLRQQRLFGRQQGLPSDRRERLLALGVRFEHRATGPPGSLTWDEMFELLRQYHQEHGHWRVPARSRNWHGLGRWLLTQRLYARRGTLSPERRSKLESLGVQFDVLVVHERSWDEMFDALRQFHAEHGHCNVPASDPVLTQLYRWLIAQRTFVREGKLAAPKRARLEALGVDCERRREPVFTWDERLGQLADFAVQHGHANAVQDNGAPSALVNWLSHQRFLHERGQLDPERVRRLEALGFRWTATDATWHQRLAELAAFRQQHGHSHPPHRVNGRTTVLAAWCVEQRTARKRGQLTADQIRLLDDLAFPWSLRDIPWDHRMAELRDFHRQHGHCRVPQTSSPGSLSAWLHHQRQARREGSLTEEQIRQFDALGFEWEPITDRWLARYEHLRAFHQRHGHCQMRRNMPGGASLLNWINDQRHACRQGRLTPKQIALLDAIKFDWCSAVEQT